MKWSQLGLINRINLSVSVYQGRHDLVVPPGSSTIQRGPTQLVPSSDLRPHVTQIDSCVHVTVQRRVMKGLVPVVIFVFQLRRLVVI